MISLMSQYTPYIQNQEFPELNRRITSYEYDKVVDAAIRLGLTQGLHAGKKAVPGKNILRPLIWKDSKVFGTYERVSEQKSACLIRLRHPVFFSPAPKPAL